MQVPDAFCWLDRWFALLVGVVLVSTSSAAAQVIPDSSRIESYLEAALEDLDPESGDATLLVERLQDLLNNPLDINAASANDLADIPAFSLLIAQRLVAFREQFGLFGSIPEIRAVEGITAEIFIAARPFLRIGPELDVEVPEISLYPKPPSLSQIVSDLDFEVIQRMTRRLDVGSGYDTPDPKDVLEPDNNRYYLGSPERLYTRLRAKYRRNVALNLTLEKDPGEAFRWDESTQTFGYDHVTGSLALRDFGRVESLVLGDFVVNYGQGLLLSQGSSFGKGRETVRSIYRTAHGFSPYGSTDENQFFRGVALAFRLTPDVSIGGFASRRSLDATLIDPDTENTDRSISSLNTTGLHRTLLERSKKDVVGEDIWGGNVTYTYRRIRVGVAGYYASFDTPFATRTRPDQRFRFSGDETSGLSTFVNAYAGSSMFFGEAVRDHDGQWAGLGGVLTEITNTIDLLVVARAYPRDFVSLHGHAFGERNGATQNESGVYMGLRVQPSRTWTISGYFDQYHFPWARTGVARPSSGFDALVVADYTPQRWLRLYVQARSETKEDGVTVARLDDVLLSGLIQATRQSLRLHGDYTFSRALRVRARAEWIRAFDTDQPKEYGLVLYQDIRWSAHPKLILDARVSFFDTDSFASRVFTYESDLLYTFSVPAFSGRGQRNYLLLTYSPLAKLDVQAKYAVTVFEDVSSVGTGLDEVSGDTVREIRLQMRWRF